MKVKMNGETQRSLDHLFNGISISNRYLYHGCLDQLKMLVPKGMLLPFLT